MTVQAQTPIKRSIANGVTTVFPYDFLLLDQNDLVVYLDDAAADPSSYSVSGIGNFSGGAVTFLSGAPVAGVIVSRIREMQLVRLVDYQNAGDFKADTVDADFDRLWMALQDSAARFGRSVHVGVDDSTPFETLQLPPIADRAGRFVTFDAEGGIAVSDGGGADAALRSDLAGILGAQMVGYQAAGLGGVPLTILSMLREFGLTPKMFGAKQDGVTDDYDAIQKCLNAAATYYVGTVSFTGKGTHLISKELLIRQAQQTSSSDVGSDIHFMPDQNKLRIKSDSHAILKASAVMSSILRFSPTTVDNIGSYANFYSEVSGLLLDGNAKATIGIYIDSAMHVKVERNAITSVGIGIYDTGYGVHDILQNVIRATSACISYVGGGDSLFEHNDLFIASGGIGILLKPFAGSSVLHRNTYTPIDTTSADSNTTAISLRADNPGDDTRALGAIKISHECFDGVRYGVYGRGYSASVINLRAIEVHSCYIGAAGASVTCDLVDFAFATALNIHDNEVTPGVGEPRVRSLGTLFGCSHSKVHDNSINGCTFDGLTLDGACSNVVVEHNKFFNVGAGNTANAFVRVKGSCDTTWIQRNKFLQSDVTGAVNGVVEEGSANNTFADYNDMYNLISVQYTKVGAASVMKSRLRLAAAPSTGTWLAGAVTEFPAPSAGGFMGQVCTTGGTPGTWKNYGAVSA